VRGARVSTASHSTGTPISSVIVLLQVTMTELQISRVM